MGLENYKQTYEKIEVPPELLARTAKKMREAQTKGGKFTKTERIWHIGLVTSCLTVMVLMTVFIQIAYTNYLIGNQIKNGLITFHEAPISFVMPAHFGKVEEKPHKQSEKKPLISIVTDRCLPNQCDTSLEMDSVINGIPLYIEESVSSPKYYNAKFIHNGLGYYVKGENISQIRFVKEISKILK